MILFQDDQTPLESFPPVLLGKVVIWPRDLGVGDLHGSSHLVWVVWWPWLKWSSPSSSARFPGSLCSSLSFCQWAGFGLKSLFLRCQLLLVILANSPSSAQWRGGSQSLAPGVPFPVHGNVIRVSFSWKEMPWKSLRLLWTGPKEAFLRARSALSPVFCGRLMLLCLTWLRRSNCLWHLQFSNWLAGKII